MQKRIAWSLTLCAALIACHRNSPPPDDATPGERVTGADRLGWDQQASDGAQLASFSYAVYLDGVRSELAGVSCGSTPAASGFACSAHMPAMSAGNHTLELAAFIVDGGVLESPRSSPLRVTFSPASVTQSAPQWQQATMVTTSDGVRLRTELVAAGLEMPTDIAFVPDGRIFVAERRGRVRVVGPTGVLPDPALILADEPSSSGDAALLAFAIDPRFDSNHFVYTLYTENDRAGGPLFTLARFREVRDTLGDRVVLLDRIAASSPDAAASLRFGLDGKLYVALDDGGHPLLAGDLASFNGKILRMNPDGTTPDDQAGATPVYSYGYRAPRALDWQAASGLLWVADSSGRESARLRAVVAEADRYKRGSDRAIYVLPPPSTASALAFYRGRLIPPFVDDLLLASTEGRHIRRIHFDARNPTRIAFTETLLQDVIGAIRVVATGRDGAIYFCTTHELAKLVPAE